MDHIQKTFLRLFFIVSGLAVRTVKNRMPGSLGVVLAVYNDAAVRNHVVFPVGLFMPLSAWH